MIDILKVVWKPRSKRTLPSTVTMAGYQMIDVREWLQAFGKMKSGAQLGCSHFKGLDQGGKFGGIFCYENDPIIDTFDHLGEVSILKQNDDNGNSCDHACMSIFKTDDIRVHGVDSIQTSPNLRLEHLKAQNLDTEI